MNAFSRTFMRALIWTRGRREAAWHCVVNLFGLRLAHREILRRSQQMGDHPHHEHGSMDITEQEKTFEGFIRVSIWVTVISIGALIFMAVFNS